MRTSISTGFRNSNALTASSRLVRIWTVFSHLLGVIRAMPVNGTMILEVHNLEDGKKQGQFLFYMIISACLVLAGGVFAGLTLGLMGQDEVYLKVIETSGDIKERRYARKVLQLIGKGKHWVLVTLLLSNVITNETLPIVLDRCLGGGWPAVVTSTGAIVIFGEIIPQSVCVRYGLEVGAMFAPFVNVLMYVMYPVAFPFAMILDHILGEDHGTVYKKSGLKTLVTLHRTMGVERLNEDEVTIIRAVLDLKEKPVSGIMTPMDRVFTMSADTILDQKIVEDILNAGFSRIPIHLPNEPLNFIGMLLVRVLISYDPEDALPIASFPLATLPETAADTSCLNILNFFQEGKSHMVIVSANPGGTTGALGVLTLEDVIEELIGEEIIDESDVYVDINKNIKRTQPAPLSKKNISTHLSSLYNKASLVTGRRYDDLTASTPLIENSSKESSPAPGITSVPYGTSENFPQFYTDNKKQWKPLNLASNPLEVNKPFVKIKRPDLEHVKSTVSTHRSSHEKQQGQNKYTQDLVPVMSSSSLNGDLEGPQNPVVIKDNYPPTDPQKVDIKEKEERRKSNGQPSPSATRESNSTQRSGGIIESVVNVQGLNKIVIENVNDEANTETENNAFAYQKKTFPESELNSIKDGRSNHSQENGKPNKSRSSGTRSRAKKNKRKLSLWSNPKDGFQNE